jgi:hypothetical protein
LIPGFKTKQAAQFKMAALTYSTLFVENRTFHRVTASNSASIGIPDGDWIVTALTTPPLSRFHPERLIGQYGRSKEVTHADFIKVGGGCLNRAIPSLPILGSKLHTLVSPAGWSAICPQFAAASASCPDTQPQHTATESSRAYMPILRKSLRPKTRTGSNTENKQQ